MSKPRHPSAFPAEFTQMAQAVFSNQSLFPITIPFSSHSPKVSPLPNGKKRIQRHPQTIQPPTSQALKPTHRRPIHPHHKTYK